MNPDYPFGHPFYLIECGDDVDEDPRFYEDYEEEISSLKNHV